MGYLFLTIAIIFGAIGQVLFKQGITNIESNSGFIFYLFLIKSKWIILGGVSYTISFAFWMQVLKFFDVSYARPFTAIGYIITYILAFIFLGEEFTIRRLFAICLITSGVFLIK